MQDKSLSAAGPLEFIILFSLITSLTAMSIDALLPALRDIQLSLSVSDVRDTQLIISIFVVGMVFGELLFGPVSDAIGRINAMLGGLLIFIIGSVVSMSADSLDIILLGRLIQGFGVSGPKIASRALIRDRFKGNEMARIMSFIFTIFILVPLIAPTLGQLVLQVSNWQGIFVMFITVALIAAIWLRMRQPETLALENRIPLSFSKSFNNLQKIAKHKRVLAYTFAAGFVFGAKLLYLSVAQAVFSDVFNIQDKFPLYFALLACGIGISSFLNSQLVRRFGAQRLAIAALSLMVFFSIILLSGSWLSNGQPPLAFFLFTCFMIFSALGLLFGNLNALAMESLGSMAGIGASFIASVSSIVAISSAVTIGRFYSGSTVVLGVGFSFGSIAALFVALRARRYPATAL